jgi:hypothetical protein
MKYFLSRAVGVSKNVVVASQIRQPVPGMSDHRGLPFFSLPRADKGFWCDIRQRGAESILQFTTVK